MYKDIKKAKPQQPGKGKKWYFKKTEEDGIVVKYDGTRLMTASGYLTEEVLKVQSLPAAASSARQRKRPQKDSVLVTCKVTNSVAGRVEFQLELDHFQSDGNAYSSLFPLTSSKEFAAHFNKSEAPQTPKGPTLCSMKASAQPEIHPVTPVTSKKTKIPCNTEGTEDFATPPKKKKQTIDEKIRQHKLGTYKLNIDLLQDCPKSWLDRPLDPVAVDKLAKVVEESIALQSETQPWLAIANIKKADLPAFQSVREMLPGTEMFLIGGRHRHAAYTKLINQDSSLTNYLEKVWVSVYDIDLTDEEVRRLAHCHNAIDTGSRQTKWIDRVASCRYWAYKLAGIDESEETPPSTQEWRKSCHTMYLANGKDCANMEPTLQAALLSKAVWDQFVMVEELYIKHELNGMAKRKPSREKKLEFKQHQVGMHLQGLDDKNKLALLSQLTTKAISLKQFQEKAQSIKNKALLAREFIRYTGCDNWTTLQMRFPKYATEEKLAQFSHLKIKKGKELPTQLLNFFQRALDVEKGEQKKRNIRLSVEGETGVYIVEFDDSLGLLIGGGMATINTNLVNRLIPVLKGFTLSVVSLVKGTTERDIKKLLMTIHAFNVESLEVYHLVFLMEDFSIAQTVKTCLKNMSCTEDAYFILEQGTEEATSLLQNAVRPMIIAQWSRDGIVKMVKPQKRSNVFNREEFWVKTAELFATSGDWMLDMTSTEIELTMSEPLKMGINVVFIREEQELRKLSRLIRQELESTITVDESSIESTGMDDSTMDVATIDESSMIDQSSMEDTDQLRQCFQQNITGLRDALNSSS